MVVFHCLIVEVEVKGSKLGETGHWGDARRDEETLKKACTAESRVAFARCPWVPGACVDQYCPGGVPALWSVALPTPGGLPWDAALGAGLTGEAGRGRVAMSRKELALDGLSGGGGGVLAPKAAPPFSGSGGSGWETETVGSTQSALKTFWSLQVGA